MNFCIIGDSWTGWSSEVYIKPIDNYLSTLGHNVTVNTSANGASNFGQLQQLKYNVIDNGIDNFDYIIWMYTEPIRNFTEFVSLDYSNDAEAKDAQYPELSYTNFYQDMYYIQHQDFKYAQQLYNKCKKPFFVIGGAGTILPSVNEFTFAKWILPSWNKEISKLDNMPINGCIHHVALTMEKDYPYNKEEILNEITNLEQLDKIMKNDKKSYSDGYHPSPELYPLLLNRMLETA